MLQFYPSVSMLNERMTKVPFRFSDDSSAITFSEELVKSVLEKHSETDMFSANEFADLLIKMAEEHSLRESTAEDLQVFGALSASDKDVLREALKAKVRAW